MARPFDLYSTKLADITSPETLCDVARPLIRAKARRLTRRPGFTADDQEDIEQEVFARLLDRFAAAQRGELPVLAFLKRVVNQSIANQIRDRIAGKRDPRRVRSIHGPGSGLSAGGGLEESLSQDHQDARHGRSSRAAQALVDLGIDLDETLERLSQDQREICEALGIHSSSELARRLGQPRTTVHDQVRKLRRQFEDAGLQAYID